MLYQLSHFRPFRIRHREGGAESQIRTGDTAIFSRVLYQLSYLGPMANQPFRLPVGAVHDTTGLEDRARKPEASGHHHRGRPTARIRDPFSGPMRRRPD